MAALPGNPDESRFSGFPSPGAPEAAPENQNKATKIPADPPRRRGRRHPGASRYRRPRRPCLAEGRASATGRRMRCRRVQGGLRHPAHSVGQRTTTLTWSFTVPHRQPSPGRTVPLHGAPLRPPAWLPRAAGSGGR